MNILLLLVPLSLVLVGIIAWVMLWAARNGQFDDLEGPAHGIVMDDDLPPRHPAGHTPDTQVPPHRS